MVKGNRLFTPLLMGFLFLYLAVSRLSASDTLCELMVQKAWPGPTELAAIIPVEGPILRTAVREIMDYELEDACCGAAAIMLAARMRAIHQMPAVVVDCLDKGSHSRLQVYDYYAPGSDLILDGSIRQFFNPPFPAEIPEIAFGPPAYFRELFRRHRPSDSILSRHDFSVEKFITAYLMHYKSRHNIVVEAYVRRMRGKKY
jgi:hypothetical protein